MSTAKDHERQRIVAWMRARATHKRKLAWERGRDGLYFDAAALREQGIVLDKAAEAIDEGAHQLPEERWT